LYRFCCLKGLIFGALARDNFVQGEGGHNPNPRPIVVLLSS